MRYFLIITFSLLISSCARDNYSKHIALYERDTISEVPDYTHLAYWAAHPSKKNPSDSIPKNILQDYHPTKNADVFFVYPTSYLDPNMPYGWSASLKDMRTNIYTDYTSILYQASVFNEVGNVYAPRYRQAHINAYTPVSQQDTLNAIAAFNLAYEDVKTAFEYYLKHYNNGRPIIIASHSQGSSHTIHLLKDFFDNKPLSNQLVVAYVVGMALDPANYTSLKACEQPGETGCLCGWRTFKEGYQAPFVDKEQFKSIVTNPLSWNNRDTIMNRQLNPGAILYNFNKVTPNVAGAVNHNGVLWTPRPHFLGSFLLKSKNYHIADYNFYYLSIRKNVALRVNNFLEKQKMGSTH